MREAIRTQRGNRWELGSKFLGGREEGAAGQPRTPAPRLTPAPASPQPHLPARLAFPSLHADQKQKQSCDFFVPLLSSLACPVCPSVSHSLQNLHQLKQIQTLKHVNEQLQAENRALTRVVARLSEAVEGSDPQGL